jgi:elongation factor Ts
MAEITATMIKDLRERTGAGMSDCKKALSETDADMEKAAEFLRKKGLAAAAKKAGRIATEGAVASYIHNGRVGVLLEVNCETDFVARTPEFADLVRNLAMQVAAAGAEYVRREEVPAERIAKEREIFAAQLEGQGKPAAIIDKIVTGKLDKFFSEVCLLEQPYVRDDKMTVGDLVTAAAAKTGENLIVRRFVRFRLGKG